MNEFEDVLSLDCINSLYPIEFECYRERGERSILIDSILRLINIPNLWLIEKERRSEFGGLYPLHLRLVSSDHSFSICILSPGFMSLKWRIVLISDDGTFFRELNSMDVFCPELINDLTVQAEICIIKKYSVRGISSLLSNTQYSYNKKE